MALDIDWYDDDTPPMTAEQIRQKIISNFKSCLTTYRDQTENHFYSGLLSSFRMDQTISVGNQNQSFDIKNNDAMAMYTTCPLNGKLTLMHTFQSVAYLPIGGTPFKLEPVVWKAGVFISDFEADGPVVTGTLDDKGLKEISNLIPGKTYRITFYPDLSRKDINAMFASYQGIQDNLSQWLDKQWQGFDSEWRHWCGLTSSQRTGELVLAAGQGVADAAASLWDSMVDMLKTAWDMLKLLWKFLTNPKLMLDKVKAAIKTTLEFDWDKVVQLLESANEAVSKALMVLQDEAYLFLFGNALISWASMIPPQVLARMSVEVIASLVIDIIVGVILTGGAGLAARYGARAMQMENKAGRALRAVMELIEKARELAHQHIPVSAKPRQAGVGSFDPHQKAPIVYPEPVKVPAAPSPSKTLPGPAARVESASGTGTVSSAQSGRPKDVPEALNGSQKEPSWPQKDGTVEARNQKHDTVIQEVKDDSSHRQPGKNDNDQPAESVSNTRCDNDPVSMVTGEELLTLEDATLDGPLPFTWQRLYRTSAVERQSGLGHGWSHSLDHELTVTVEAIHWRDHEGRTTTFPHPSQQRPAIHNPLAGAALYLGDEPSAEQRQRGVVAELILTQPGLPFYHFRIVNTDGQGGTAQARGTIQAHGYLHAITDAYHNRLTLRYDQHGRLSALEGQQQQALRFHYLDQPVGERHWWNVLDKPGSIALLAHVEMQRMAVNADESGYETRRFPLMRYHYNDQLQLIAADNALGEQETYRYDDQHVIQERRLAGGACFTWQWERQGKAARAIAHGCNIPGLDNRYEWNDASGEVTVHFSDGSQQVYQHDHHAKLIRQTDPDGATVSKDYNDNGDLIRKVDALGAETHYHYDQNGQLETIRHPDGSLTHYDYWRGQLRSVRRGEHHWRYLRNEQGDITEKTDPAGRVHRYHYTEQGQLSRIDLPDGGRHLFSWNRFGQLVDETLPDGGQRTYRYDAQGRQVLRQDERGAITRYAYDKLNRLTRLTLPGGASRQYDYNAYGKLRRYTDEQGRTTEYDYAQPLHLVTAQRNPDGSTLRFRYDDRRLQLTDIENENGDHYRLSYHPSGLVKEETDFAGRTTRYEYDLAGRLTEKTDVAASPPNTDAATLTTRFTRDLMGRLTEKILPDGQRIHYHYDLHGQLLQVDDGHWPLYFEYDAQGRLMAEHQQRHTLRYGYDHLGRLNRLKLPDGNRLHYHYGPHSQLSGIDLNEKPLTRHSHEYGQEVSRWQGALTSTWHYDEQGRLTEQQRHRTGQRGPIHQRRYQYNAVGNLITLDDSDKGTLHYDYDPLDRLTAVRGAIEEQFHHDPAGNLLNQRDPTDPDASPYGHSAQGNRLTVQGDRHLEYDGFGNLITEYRGAGHRLVTRYHYDTQHRLSQVTLPNLSTVRYRYDAFGRRISKDIGGYLTTFIWQANRLIAETDDFSHYRSYLYEPGTYRPLAQLEGEGNLAQVYYYHLDHLGTPQEMTAANGERVWSVQYKAYGHVKRTLIEKVDTNLRFQGQYYDGETGLHYNRHRYYHPGTGHFLTPDPIKLAGGLNHYQYVPNPVNWVDPLGLACTGCDVPNKSPRARIPESQRAVFKEFEEHHKGQFSSDVELVDAFEELRDKESPWPVGYVPKEKTMSVGEEFKMIVNDGAENMPGRFGTPDSINSPEYGRQELAIKEGWKPTLDQVVTYRVRKPFSVLYGPVGPQIELLPNGEYRYLRGGGNQIQMSGDVWSTARPNKYNDYTNDPYLDVVNVNKLPQE